jgi:dihydroxyacetone kinase
VSTSLRAAILAAAVAVEAQREALCELDAKTGDGDHGVTMTMGARGVRRGLEGVAGEDPVALVRAAALGMAGAGGAIGPIYGRGLLAVATELEAIRSGPGGIIPADPTTLARCAAAAQAAVVSLGGASPGDKTILDALAPTTAALEDADRRHEPLDAALAAARAAATDGAEATAAMAARIGRSARFGERSRGLADAGATSFAIVVGALVDAATAADDPATAVPPEPVG